MSPTNSPIVVVADDDLAVRSLLQEMGEDLGLRVISCSTVAEATAAIDRASQANELVGVISDLKITAQEDDGWGVLSHAYRKSRALRLALFTGYGDQPVQSLFKSGVAVPAFTVFRKTYDNKKLQDWMRATRDAWHDRISLSLKDAGTKHIYDTIAPIYARSKLPMLILGETGTGKESLAEHIHQVSLQRDGQMLKLNCGGLEPSLAFSELFGHTANAFTDAGYHELGLVLQASGYQAEPRDTRDNSLTFEGWLRLKNPDIAKDQYGLLTSKEAERRAGTLFLDEVATMPKKVMAGLLRVLSTGDVLPFGHHGAGIRSYCRIIAATNETDVLESSVNARADESATFRRDLCYRLGGAILTLAPLRERDPEDIRNYVERTVWRSEERRVGKECRSRWSPYH